MHTCYTTSIFESKKKINLNIINDKILCGVFVHGCGVTQCQTKWCICFFTQLGVPVYRNQNMEKLRTKKTLKIKLNKCSLLK